MNLKSAANFLIENGLVEPITEGFSQAGGGLRATVLGKAIASSALSIEEGLFVHRELERSVRSFILDDELVFAYFFPLTIASLISLHTGLLIM